MGLATDYGAVHRQALIRAARVATACHITQRDRRRADRARRAHILAVYELGDLLAALASRDPAAHDHLQGLLQGVAAGHKTLQVLHSAAERYALALLEEEESAR